MSHDNSSTMVIARSIAQCVFSLIAAPKFCYQGKSLADWDEFLRSRSASTPAYVKIWHGALENLGFPHLPLSSKIRSLQDINEHYIIRQLLPLVTARQQRILDGHRIYNLLKKYGTILTYYYVDWSQISAPNHVVPYQQQILANIIKVDADGFLIHQRVGSNRYGESLFAISRFGQLKHQLNIYVGEIITLDKIIQYSNVQSNAIFKDSIPAVWTDGIHISDLQDNQLNKEWI